MGAAHGECSRHPVATLAHLARVGDLIWLLHLRTEVRIPFGCRQLPSCAEALSLIVESSVVRSASKRDNGLVIGAQTSDGTPRSWTLGELSNKWGDAETVHFNLDESAAGRKRKLLEGASTAEVCLRLYSCGRH